MPQSPLVSFDFSNTELAFRARDDKDLKWLYRLYRLIDSPFLTRIGPPIISQAVNIGLPVEGLMKRTLFRIFCGGVSLEDSVNSSSLLEQFGVKTILDYAVEGEKSEGGFDETFKQLRATIIHGGKYSAVSFVACKLTGLVSFDLLAKYQAGDALNEEEQHWLEKGRERLEELCKSSAEHEVPLFVDAEESWIQATVDEWVEAMMEKYNREKAIVFTTIQLYRHDKLAYLRALIKQSKERAYVLGVKLVRGAYIEKENQRARELAYVSPIQKTKADTDRDFDLALEDCIDHIDHVSICAGTHNEASSKYLADLMEEKKLGVDHPHICFAQLLGMSDHISYNLAEAGYHVAKYVPYGPVKSVIPYLMRRAQENTAIAGQSSREVELIRKELDRRKG